MRFALMCLCLYKLVVDDCAMFRVGDDGVVVLFLDSNNNNHNNSYRIGHDDAKAAANLVYNY